MCCLLVLLLVFEAVVNPQGFASHCVHTCTKGHHIFTQAGGTWSRDRAGANEDTYLLLVISTGDVLSAYLLKQPFDTL